MKKLNYINQISNNLENKNGIWFSKSEALVSFPEEGYDSCYKIEEDSFWFRHRNNCIIEVAKLPIPIYLFRTLPGKFKKHYNTNNSESQHNQKKGIISILLDKIWEKELSLIKRKKKIPFGGSCLIAAEKR